MAKLGGKAVIVTGASKGIGAAIAKAMAEEGAEVVVNYASSAAGAERVVKEIGAAGGKAFAVQADVSKKAEIARLFAEADRHLGRLDILVNNAGIYQFAPLEDISEDFFYRQFDLNVLGALLCAQAAAQRFGANGGCIINVSSIAAVLGMPGGAVYCATKSALDAITRSLAQELGPRGIRVHSINPGMVETEGVRAAGIHESDMRRDVEAKTPLGRIGQPADVAGAAVFLASDAAGWITGESLILSGGYR